MLQDRVETALLCEVRIELDADAPVAVGRTPWRNRRISNISGGVFDGPRLRGRVRASGADWSEGSVARDGGIATLLDVRSLWETHDHELIYVSYGGRLVIPKDVVAEFADPEQVANLDPSRYYFRIAPLVETASDRYGWLNEIVAVAIGRRTAAGVDYRIFEIC
jgi:hypothetical protein